MSAPLGQLEGRERRAECEKHEELEPCPNCGSGDVRFCAIAVRYHCGECGHGPVNFGSKADGRAMWNKNSRRANQRIDDYAALSASHQRLKEALRLCAAVCSGDTTTKAGLIEALEAAREALRSAP